MSASTDVPITITPEAAARLDELGMHEELEQMITHVCEVVSDLVGIEVEIVERYDSGGEPGVRIRAYTVQPNVPGNRISWDLIRWDVETFPSRVLGHLNIDPIYGRPNAG